jgi:N-acetylneuraminic acid mutarotase
MAVSSTQPVIAGNMIYIVGGWDNGNVSNAVYSATFASGVTDYAPYYTDQPSTSITSSFVESAGAPWQFQYGFNPSTQSNITGWTSTNSLVTFTSDAASLVTKNYIYILGGYTLNDGTLNTIQRASVDANGNLTSTWSNVGTLPDTIGAMGYAATKGRFYLIGGFNGTSSLSTVYSAPINADGTLGTFRTETPLPAIKDDATCFVVKNKLYVVGGAISNTVYRATINTDGTLSGWETLPNFPINFSFGKPLIIKDRIYIFVIPVNNESKVYYTTYDSDGNISTWVYVTNMPNNIYGSSIVSTDNYVFSIGGYNGNTSTYTNASYRAPILDDGSIGAWTQISDAPTAVVHAQSPIVGNKIYFIGGYNNSTGRLNTVYSATFTSGITDYTPYYTDQPSTTITSSFVESAGRPWQSQWGFNPSTQSDITDWTSTNSLTVTTYGAASLVTKNYIYILGGANSSGYLNAIQRASFDSNGNLTSTWSNVGTIPVAIDSMGYVATKGRIYLIGGENSAGAVSTVYSAPINADGTLGTFRTEASLPDVRSRITYFVIKNKLYVAGGMNTSNAYANTVYRATINTDGTLSSWETLPNFPIGFRYGKPLLINDRIYIFGAYDGSGSNVYYATYDSDGNIDTWTYVTNMPNNIYASATVSTDNYVFSMGGYNGNNSTYTNAAYRAPILADGSIGAWTQISNTPIASTFAQSAIAGSKIYFIGGFNDSGYLNTVYSATFTSGITDYTPYYTDQPNTSSTFMLPDLTYRSIISPKMKYIIKT